MKFRRSLLLVTVLCSLFTVSVRAADLIITAASVIPSDAAKLGNGIAGATITAGQLLYQLTSDGKLYLADANASAATAKVIGMATTAASAGQRVGYVIEDPNLTIGATVAAGSIYILSGTAGAFGASADAVTGWYVSVCAIGNSTTTVKFQIVRSDAIKL